MNRRELALLFDQQNLPREACWAYELAIMEPAADLDLYLNLAVLYFDLSDYGVAKSLELHQAFVATAAVRCYEILDAAEAAFGPLPEVQFWRRYFAVIHTGAPDFEAESAELLRQFGCLVVVFYLFLFDSETYRANAEQLRLEVSGGETAKKRYIRSVLDAEFERRAARRSD